jgi:modification methylase
VLPSSRQGDLVIDPFNGTGTTGAVAKRSGRHIGFDATSLCAAEAHRRRRTAAGSHTRAIHDRARCAAAAFSELIERGMISPGTRPVDSGSATVPELRRRRHHARR